MSVRTIVFALAVACVGAHAAGPAVNVHDVDGECGKVYPKESARRGESGTVSMHVEIDAAGAVTQARVRRSSGFERLDQETRAQILACRFTPPRDAAGESTTASLDIDYAWKLDTGTGAPPPGAITESMVRAEYERLRASTPTEQVHTRHILVATRDQAQAVLQRLRAGQSWADVARETSLDTGSGAKGGDLGWGFSRDYVTAFAAAIEQAKPQGLVAEPVKTEFGWHVLEVTETRPTPFPSYAEAHDRILAELSRRQRR